MTRLILSFLVLVIALPIPSFAVETWSYLHDDCRDGKAMNRWRYLPFEGIVLRLENGLKPDGYRRYHLIYKFKTKMHSCPVEIFGWYRLENGKLEFKLDGTDSAVVEAALKKCGVGVDANVGSVDSYEFLVEDGLLKIYKDELSKTICGDEKDKMFEVYRLIN